MTQHEESPEQQLIDMASKEEDPFLKRLLIATAARKITEDILRGKP